MQSRQTKKQTNAPEQRMFQERSFGVPVKKVQKSPQATLSKSLMRAEQYGHHLSQMDLPSVSEPPLQMQSLSMGHLPISKPLVQPKLTIGQPGNKYEQEANKLASQVVNQINALTPQSDQSQPVQRETIPEEEDELMMKPEISRIQREPIPEEEKQLQMKSMLQLQAADGDTAATPDLEASINQAQGSEQPLAENIRQPMEQAFGADFSGVKVHTDAQSDQLNRSIQAKAFTTGQDVFFRQGEYNPGSRDGQELLAHELTHVVQQSGKGGRGIINRMEGGSNSSPPFAYKIQAHEPPDNKLCLYFAYYHYMNGQVDKNEFISKAIQPYIEIGMSKEDALEKFYDGNDPGVYSKFGLSQASYAEAIDGKRLIVADVNKGHFYALLYHEGNWWNYDSYYQNKPTLIGDREAAIRYLKDKRQPVWK